jgi:NAD(P)-dependent dehydrogenase (short-subunit alcohol dehydrogenase family)
LRFLCTLGPYKLRRAFRGNGKAIIVGGASGMARATAEMLVRDGAHVAILDRPQSKGEEGRRDDRRRNALLRL